MNYKVTIEKNTRIPYADLLAFADNGIASSTLLKTDTAEVCVMTLDEGEEISEHAVPKEVLIQVLEGRIAFTIEDKQLDICPGEIVRMAPQAPHSLRALEPSRMMLSLLSV